MAQRVDTSGSSEMEAATPEAAEAATTDLDDLADLEDVEFLLEEIEDQIAPL
jgi:hypothetical protein